MGEHTGGLAVLADTAAGDLPQATDDSGGRGVRMSSLSSDPWAPRWADASSFVERVCAEMKVGQLLHGENFSLYESMSALEMMDPKMDAGMHGGGYPSIDEALAASVAPVDLSIAQTIDVMDELLSCEATWHQGHSLAQTVYTCLYMHRPELTSPNLYLHAYCCAVRTACNTVCAAMNRARVHEEEDFATHTFGLPVDPGGTDAKTAAFLDLAEKQLTRLLRLAQGGDSSRRKADAHLEPLQANPLLEEAYCSALLARIRFRKARLTVSAVCLLCYQCYQLAGSRHMLHVIGIVSNMPSRQTLQSVWTALDEPRHKGLETARKHIATAKAELADVRTTRKACQPLAGDSETQSSSSVPGFDPAANHKLLAPAPPRRVDILPTEKAFDHFDGLLDDLHAALAVTEVSTIPALEDVLIRYARRQPGPVALARVRLLALEDGKIHGRIPVPDAVCELLRLPAKPARLEPPPLLRAFVESAAKVANNLFMLYCRNVARQRRQLVHVLEDWNILQADASHVEQDTDCCEWLRSNSTAAEGLRERALSSWTLQGAVHSLLYHLSLGFELDLYAPADLCMVYWYMDYLHGILCQDIHAQRVAVEAEYQQLMLADAEAAKSGKKKPSKKNRTAPRSAKLSQELASLTESMLWLETHGLFCRALVQMIAELKSDGAFPKYNFPFNTEAERFDQRFQHFWKVYNPPVVSYQQYEMSLEMAPPSLQYSIAVELFMRARLCAARLARSGRIAEQSESLQELAALEQVAVKNTVALHLLHRTAGAGDSWQVRFDLSAHRHFVVASVKRTT
eukprot:jgi/Chlat1/8485/Chrsp80S07932